MPLPVLYQFAGSNFCEKARWALAYKGVAYRDCNLVPGLHRGKAVSLARNPTLPILVDGDHTVQGSPEIITYLDGRKPHPLLTPANSQDASMAHEWERYLDRNLGVPLRLLFFHFALDNRDFAKTFLLRDAPWGGRMRYFFTSPVVARALRKQLGIIDTEAVENARERLRAAFDRLDERLGAHKFLAGRLFSRADLTASALLFYWWSDEWSLPPPLNELILEFAARPAYAWSRDIYTRYRHQG